MSSQTLSDLVKNQSAATVAATAPAILGTQETFDDETHLLAISMVAAAYSTLAPQLRGLPWQPLLTEALEVQIRPPGDPYEDTLDLVEELELDFRAARGWWFAGGRPTVSGREYVAAVAAAVPPATRDFFIPHRNTVEGAYFGGLVNQLTEHVWLMLEDEPEFFKWELTTDARLLSSLLEAGRLYNYTHGEDTLWAIWQDARRALEYYGQTSLQAEQWDHLAQKHGAPLIKLLPPGSPWPPEWETWIAQQGPGQDFPDAERQIDPGR